MRFKKLILNGKKRRLSRALTIADLRLIAKRRTPKGPFDYTDGAAESETSLTRARNRFEAIEFLQIFFEMSPSLIHQRAH